MKLKIFLVIIFLVAPAHFYASEPVIFLTIDEAYTKYNSLVRAIELNNLHDFKRIIETVDEDNRQRFFAGLPILYQGYNQLLKKEINFSSLLKYSLEKRSDDIAAYILTLRISDGASLSNDERNLINTRGNEQLARLAEEVN